MGSENKRVLLLDFCTINRSSQAHKIKLLQLTETLVELKSMNCKQMMEIKYLPNMQCEENWAIWTVLLFRSSLRYRKETSLFRKDIKIKLDSSFRFPVLWLEKGHKPLLTLDYSSDKIISGLWEYFTGSHLQYCFPFAALPSGKKRSSLTRRLSPFWNSERPEKERHSFSTNQVNLEFAWINKSCNGPNTVKAINDPGVKIVICALR